MFIDVSTESYLPPENFFSDNKIMSVKGIAVALEVNDDVQFVGDAVKPNGETNVEHEQVNSYGKGVCSVPTS